MADTTFPRPACPVDLGGARDLLRFLLGAAIQIPADLEEARHRRVREAACLSLGRTQLRDVGADRPEVAYAMFGRRSRAGLMRMDGVNDARSRSCLTHLP